MVESETELLECAQPGLLSLCTPAHGVCAVRSLPRSTGGVSGRPPPKGRRLGLLATQAVGGIHKESDPGWFWGRCFVCVCALCDDGGVHNGGGGDGGKQAAAARGGVELSARALKGLIECWDGFKA